MIKPFKKSALIIWVLMPLAIFTGCASHEPADVKAVEARSITEISTSEDSETVTVIIMGNQYLNYTAVTLVSPIGLLFHFPKTALGNIKPVYTPPDNEIIISIETSEIVKEKTTKSRIFIALKKETPYHLTPLGEGIQISFPRLQAESAEKISEPETTPTSMPAATRLEAVTATTLENNVIVNIQADGTISDYKSFTLDSPPRIVFDMYNIKSPYDTQQKIAVESKWVNQVRHFAYPDKVRLVLDTYKDYLSKYSASPTDNGLLIHVGNLPVTQPNND
jgi:type IV pilus assembly protein PilQ